MYISKKKNMRKNAKFLVMVASDIMTRFYLYPWTITDQAPSFPLVFRKAK